MAKLTVSVGTFKTGELGFLVLKDGFLIESGYVPGDFVDQAVQGIRIASLYCNYGDKTILETRAKVFYNHVSMGKNGELYLGLLDAVDTLKGSFGTRYTKNTAVSRYQGNPPKKMKIEGFRESAFVF